VLKPYDTSELPFYTSLFYENVLGSADSTLYSLGTFNLGVFTPHSEGDADYNTEDVYDCTAPLPIFPIHKNQLHNVSQSHNLHFIDYWPLGFQESDWDQIWNGCKHKIDQYLCQAQSIYNGTMLPWTDEYKHKGASYWLTINHQCPLDRLLIFTHRMIIFFLNCNGKDN